MTRAVGFILCLGLLSLVLATATRASSDQSPEQSTLSAAQDADLTITAEDEALLDTFRNRIDRGLVISPVRLDFTRKNRKLIGLGSYIVNAQGGCNDCHTNPPYLAGGDPFLGQRTRINAAGYLGGGTPFGPVIRSRNLTPQNGRPAHLTFEQFRVVMRTGIDLDKEEPHVPSLANDLLQVMPWPVFRHMRRADLRAIYEYLRAIPSIPEEE